MYRARVRIRTLMVAIAYRSITVLGGLGLVGLVPPRSRRRTVRRFGNVSRGDRLLAIDVNPRN